GIALPADGARARFVLWHPGAQTGAVRPDPVVVRNRSVETFAVGEAVLRHDLIGLLVADELVEDGFEPVRWSEHPLRVDGQTLEEEGTRMLERHRIGVVVDERNFGSASFARLWVG